MILKEDWTIAVFVCQKSDFEKILLALGYLMREFEEKGKAKSFNFTNRGEMDNDRIIISFRVYREKTFEPEIESALSSTLLKFVGNDNYQVPPKDDFFKANVQFLPYDEPEKVTTYWGNVAGWKIFCTFLNRLALLSIDLARQGQFEGKKRQEIGHLALNVLCVEEFGYTRGALHDRLAIKGMQSVYPY